MIPKAKGEGTTMEMTSTTQKLVKRLVRSMKKKEEKMTRNQRNTNYWKGQRMVCM